MIQSLCLGSTRLPWEWLLGYAYILSQYPFLSNGYDLPKPVPEELLVLRGEFVNGHSFSSLMYTVCQYLEGLGNSLAQPALYVVRDFSLDLVHDLLVDGQSFASSARNGNQEVYEQALKAAKR